MSKKKITKLLLILTLCLTASSVYAGEALDFTKEFEAQSSIKTEETSQDIETVQNKTKFSALKNLKFWDKDKTQKTEKKSKKNNISNSIQTEEDLDEQEKTEIKGKKRFIKSEKAKETEKFEAEYQGPTTDVLVDSDSIEYFPERHEFEAVGNARVSFPSENSVLQADKIVFNHDTNLVKGFGHVVLIKQGQKVYGDYIQVDLNDNNAMMSHPVVNHMAIKITAKEGIVSDAKTEALDGFVTFNSQAAYKFTSRPLFGFDKPMLDSIIPKHFYFKEKYENKWKLKAKTIIIDSYKDRDVATLKNADIYLKNVRIGSAGRMRLFTDKEQQYVETNMLEIGSLRNMGAYLSPGYVFQTPNASTLKLGPALTYNHDIGIGAVGRFMTDKNRTAFGWSTAKDKVIIRGDQELTDDLKLQYGMHSYLSNFFLGSRLPKYGFQLIHHKSYEIEELGVSFQNRFSGGFYRDWGAHDYSTTKFAWQTQSTKSLFGYKNEEAKFAADTGATVQTHASVYGNGNTMGVIRVGPYLKTQYRSWQQYIAYFLGGQAGDSPMNFDRNFYGKSNVVLGESLRICKYLTLMYSTTIVLSNDTPNGDMMQENRFYFLIGPDDLKFMIGYDAYRQNATLGFSMNIGAENSDVEFKRLVLNDPEAIAKKQKSEREIMAAQKKKAAEEKKKREQETMNRSVKDYDDYMPTQFNNFIPGASLQPSMFRPPGM